MTSENASNDTSARQISAAAFVVIALLMAVDITGDAMTGSSLAHLIVEAAVLLVSAVGASSLYRQYLAARRLSSGLRRQLVSARKDSERWRAEAQDALRGLGKVIDAQFDRWGLSSAEREVALLLLKGLSFKEIAGVRNTSERTVRQQSLAVYRKAELGGRAELSAFFLEDLLLPLHSDAT